MNSVYLKYCISFLILITSFSTKAQSVDSLISIANKEITKQKKVDKLNELSIDYKSKNYSVSKELAYQAEKIANAIQYKDGEAIALRNQGVVLTNESKLDEALNVYTKALTLTKNKKIIGQLYGSISRVYSNKSEFVKALDYSYKSLSIFEEIEDLQLQYVSLYNIANLNLQMGNTEKYYEYKNRAAALDNLMKQESIKTPKTAGPFLEIKKESAKKQDSINKKPSYYELRIAEATKNNNLPELAESLMAEGKIQTENNNLEKGIELLNLALSIETKLNNPYEIALTKYLLGNAEKKVFIKTKQQQNLNKAEKHYIDCLTYFKNNRLTIDELNTYENLSELYELKGNNQKALEYNKLAYDKYQVIYNNDNKQTVKDLENKYKLEIKNKEIEINQLELKDSNKKLIILIIVSIFFSLIGGLLYFQKTKQKKTNQELLSLNHELDQANKVKTRFFSILNHDLRSPVANLIHFLHLQKDNPDLLDEATKKRFEEKTMEGAENLLTSMEDLLLWSKGQMENFKPQPQKTHVSKLFDDTKKVFSGYQNIKFEYLNPENIEIFTDENYLKTIVRNLTSNAINVFTSTTNPTIIWKAWQENNQSYLSITDNGPGASLEQFKALYDDKEVVGIKTGLGLHLIRDLAKAINCEIIVDSKINEGTTFILKL